MVRLTDHHDMTIAVDWNIKLKPNKITINCIVVVAFIHRLYVLDINDNID